MPDTGAIDFSPLVLIVLLNIVNIVLRQSRRQQPDMTGAARPALLVALAASLLAGCAGGNRVYADAAVCRSATATSFAAPIRARSSPPSSPSPAWRRKRAMDRVRRNLDRRRGDVRARAGQCARLAQGPGQSAAGGRLAAAPGVVELRRLAGGDQGRLAAARTARSAISPPSGSASATATTAGCSTRATSSSEPLTAPEMIGAAVAQCERPDEPRPRRERNGPSGDRAPDAVRRGELQRRRSLRRRHADLRLCRRPRRAGGSPSSCAQDGAMTEVLRSDVSAE